MGFTITGAATSLLLIILQALSIENRPGAFNESNIMVLEIIIIIIAFGNMVLLIVSAIYNGCLCQCSRKNKNNGTASDRNIQNSNEQVQVTKVKRINENQPVVMETVPKCHDNTAYQPTANETPAEESSNNPLPQCEEN